MAKKPYTPSGKSGDGAVPVLFISAVLAGLVMGGLEGYISRWFSLLILFPLVLGGAVGIACTMLVENRQVRAPAVALLAGLLGGAVGQTALHVVQWQHFAAEVKERLAEPAEDPKWAAKSADDKLDAVLRERTGETGFLGYLLFSAQEGVEIKRTGRSSGAPLKGTAFWGLFALEYLLAMGAAGWVAYRRAQEPFCEICQRWYAGEQVIGMAAGDKATMKETLGLLERGELERLKQQAGTPTQKAALVLTARICEQCQESEPLLFAKQVINPGSSKPQIKYVYASLVTRDDLKQLQSGFAEATTAS